MEIPISAATLGGTLANMRTWLDHNHCEPVRFETHSRKPGSVVIRVEFKSDGDAEAFRLAFGTGAAETMLATARPRCSHTTV